MPSKAINISLHKLFHLVAVKSKDLCFDASQLLSVYHTLISSPFFGTITFPFFCIRRAHTNPAIGLRNRNRTGRTNKDRLIRRNITVMNSGRGLSRLAIINLSLSVKGSCANPTICRLIAHFFIAANELIFSRSRSAVNHVGSVGASCYKITR